MEEIKVFTGAELNDTLELHTIKTDLQNHLVFDHSYTDNINLCITVLNLILVIYVYYKLNTNKNG
jgi:hypothetical protein